IAVYGDEADLHPGFSTFLYYLLTFIDFALMLYNNLLVALVLNIMRKSAVFHPNLINLSLLYLSHVFIHTVSRIILFLYQHGPFTIDDCGITNITDIVVILASLLRSIQQYSVCFLLSAIISMFVVFFNRRRCNNILLSDSYTLNEKYQLMENLRAFKFFLVIIIWGAVG
ncbi:hypothetical protein PFISCL1PPCAC_15835, partial [Pristionchus fissidentatus]